MLQPSFCEHVTAGCIAHLHLAVALASSPALPYPSSPGPVFLLASGTTQPRCCSRGASSTPLPRGPHSEASTLESLCACNTCTRKRESKFLKVKRERREKREGRRQKLQISQPAKQNRNGKHLLLVLRSYNYLSIRVIDAYLVILSRIRQVADSPLEEFVCVFPRKYWLHGHREGKKYIKSNKQIVRQFHRCER